MSATSHPKLVTEFILPLAMAMAPRFKNTAACSWKLGNGVLHEQYGVPVMEI